MILRFLFGIAWGASWHFSKHLIDATIKKAAWADTAGKTTGVVITFPFVLWWVVMLSRMVGIPEEYIDRVKVAVTCGYFMAFLSCGIGKVVGTALDEHIAKETGNALGESRKGKGYFGGW